MQYSSLEGTREMEPNRLTWEEMLREKPSLSLCLFRNFTSTSGKEKAGKEAVVASWNRGHLIEVSKMYGSR